MQPMVQEFPAEYFSGADVAVYFNNQWLEDITHVNFRLFEQVRPLYSYASYTYDKLLRGTRLIQGEFRIAFKEPGYLLKILEEKAFVRPAQETVPPRRHIELPDLRMGDTGASVTKLQNALAEQRWGEDWKNRSSFKDTSWGSDSLLEHWKEEAQFPVTPENYTSDNHRTRVLAIAKGYLTHAIIYGPLQYSLDANEYCDDTIEAIREYQRMANLSVTGTITEETFDGIASPFRLTGTFDLQTRRLVVDAQKHYGMTVTGDADQDLYERLFPFEEDMTDYEKQELKRRIWDQLIEPERRMPRGPYFPTSFSILFNYGSREQLGQIPYIRALRDVQVSANTHWVGYQQSRSVDEVYEFVARDMDREEPFDLDQLHAAQGRDTDTRLSPAEQARRNLEALRSLSQ